MDMADNNMIAATTTATTTVVVEEDDGRKIINKHQAIIYKKGELSAGAHLVLNSTYAFVLMELVSGRDREEYLIPLKYYEKELDWKHPDTPKLLSHLDEICSGRIQWNYLVKDRKNKQIWQSANDGKLVSKTGKGNVGFMSYEHEPYARYVKIYIPEPIRKIIKNPNAYSPLDFDMLKDIINKTAKYTAVLCELLVSEFVKNKNKDRKIEIKFNLAQYRNLLGVGGGEYKRSSDFKKYCISKPFDFLCNYFNKKLENPCDEKKLKIEYKLTADETTDEETTSEAAAQGDDQDGKTGKSIIIFVEDPSCLLVAGVKKKYFSK